MAQSETVTFLGKKVKVNELTIVAYSETGRSTRRFNISSSFAAWSAPHWQQHLRIVFGSASVYARDWDEKLEVVNIQIKVGA